MDRRAEHIGLLTALTLFGAAIPAFAEPTPAESAPDASPSDRNEARRLTEQGMRLFRAGDYESAIAAFDGAYRLSQSPLLLYNMAQAYRLHGDCARAVSLYRRFLEFAPGGAAGRFAEERVLELGECGRGQSDAEMSPSSRSAGAEVVAASPRIETAPIVTGREQPPWARLQRAPRERAHAHGSSRRTWAIVGTGSTALLLGLAGYFAWRADHASAQVSQVFSDRGQWNAAFAHAERAGMRDSKLSIAALIGGSVTAGVATWLWTFE